VGRRKLDQSAFEIANRIRVRREELGLTIAELAERIGQAPATYKAWEKQFGPASQAKYLDKLSQALSISEIALIGEEVGDTSTSVTVTPAKALSPAELDKLGLRAKQRRKEIKLNLPDISLRTGVKRGTLRTWEISIPRNITQENVEKWESALRVPNGWLLNLEMEIPAPELMVINTRGSLTASEEIRTVGCWVARIRDNKTTRFSELSEAEARTAEIFALRYGVAGEDSSILQVIGDNFGLTRERVRQIVDKAIKRLRLTKIETPITDSIFNKILAYLPASVADLDQEFREQLGESLSIESLDRFSREILGKGRVHVTERPGGMAKAWDKVVTNPVTHNEAKLRAIRDAAFDMIRSCGGAQINWVAGTASWQCGEVVTAQDILKACRIIPGFHWLVEEDGWFWFGEEMPENRVLNLSKKMLAVAGRRLDTEDIQQGLSRARRYYYDPNRPRPIMIEPPFKVVKAILSQVSWVKVIQSDDFVADPMIPVEDVLSDSELQIFKLMLRSGGVMSRYEIKKATQGLFSDIMLSVNLDNSPIFSWLEIGVFALRGRQLSITSIQRAMESVRGTLAKPIELVNGSVNFQLALTAYHLRNKFLEVPVKVCPYMEDGEYVVDGFDTPARSSIKYRRIYHLIQKMIKMGYGAGDRVTIQILPSERKIRIMNST
jgi:transcriptional regulator with XRE-family HTH domain